MAPASERRSSAAPMAPSAPSREQKRDEPVVWPRDLNSPTTKDPLWGSDPEALRDA